MLILYIYIPATLDVSDGTKFVKGNFGMFGYYRVNYDEALWQKIIQQLKDDHTVS